MSKHTIVTVTADADADNCLTAAAEAYIAEHPELAGYDLDPRWTDEDTRETVDLTVPGVSATTVDTLTSEQVDALETEAAQAGDLEMVAQCRLVTEHWNSTVVQQRSNQSALRKVLAAINHAEAQR